MLVTKVVICARGVDVKRNQPSRLVQQQQQQQEEEETIITLLLWFRALSHNVKNINWSWFSPLLPSLPTVHQCLFTMLSL